VAGIPADRGRFAGSPREFGKVHPADIVILAIGVRPETALAEDAGSEIGQRGGIRVDEQLRTSDPTSSPVGDDGRGKDFVTGQWSPCRARRTGQTGRAGSRPT